MRLKAIISVFISVILAFGTEKMLFSQTLPPLPTDSSVSQGVLPDGVRYYLCANHSVKGMAAVSLVQRMDGSESEEHLYKIAGKRLSTIQFANTSFHSFLARNGVVPGREGFIRAKRGSIEYHFDRLSISSGTSVLDSTIFAIFSLISYSSREGQPSSSQAIILSGDFDVKTAAEKMRLLSIFCPKSPGTITPVPYSWEPPVREKQSGMCEKPLSGWFVEWRSARVPDALMATVVPVVKDKLSAELGKVLEDRIYRACHNRGLHVWVDFKYSGSPDKVGDECFRLSVFCAKSVMEDVKKVMDRELDRLYTWGVDKDEYVYARDSYHWEWFREVHTPLHPNTEVIRRCRDNFLHGSSLASGIQRMKSVYKDMPDTTQTRLFNNYMRELMGQTAMRDESLLSQHVRHDNDDITKVLQKYNPKNTLKLPKDRDEYRTKGQIWTFPNGVNVIYKQMPTDGMIYYTFAAKGGRQWADPDYLNGLDGVYDEQYMSYLRTCGVDLNVKLNPTDVRLGGTVPAVNVEKMLQVVGAIVGQSENEKVFGDDTYKLFVMVGDMPADKVKALMGYYVTVLGNGSKWLPGTMVEEDTSERRWYGKAETVDFHVHLALSATNNALQSVARLVLEDALADEFDNCAVTTFVDCGFLGFPTDLYRLTLGVEAVDAKAFALGTTSPDMEKAVLRMKSVMRRLAASPMDESLLSKYRSIASDEFKSVSATPEYFVEIALDRYLDNRNLTSRFDVNLKFVTPQSIQQFFANATASYTD